MTRNLWTIILLSLLVVAFLAVSAFGMHPSEKNKFRNSYRVNEMPRAKLAGAEKMFNYVPFTNSDGQSLGFDEVASNSPGITIGYSTYDYQSNGRMNRQVDWRGSEMVHFDWMKQLDSTLGGGRGTGYEGWDPDEGTLLFEGPGGGCNLHPLTGSGINYSGYAGLDVDTEGKVNCSNHHEEGAGYSSTIWYDYESGACFFSPYRSRIPDSLYDYPGLEHPGDPEYIWPNHEYQVYDGDTVTHVFAQQGNTSGSSGIAYFRRIGSDTLGHWDYPPMMVDTVDDLGQTVTASRVSGKVALVWIANLPSVPGTGESVTRGSQRDNDIYYAMSYDMGATWGTGGLEKFNVTKSDSSKVGWRAHCDLSCLIGTDDMLHVIWDAREYSPSGGGTFPHAYGSRLFHWDENTDEIRVIKDANWDLDEDNPCHGGAWNELSIVKMQISECDGKFYALFVQFNDIFNGVTDDCSEDAFTSGAVSGGANGELYISVSDNGGYNWDVARNLTNSYSAHCDQPGEGSLECDADQWPSMGRFGMQVVDGDFTGADIVDPSGSYTGDYYLDILYVNDKYPGGCVQDQGVWTYNPLKWFRVPCIEPVPNPVLSISPSEIADPTWTKPSTQLDTSIRLENVGNAPLHVTSITVTEVTGSGWLAIGAPPTTISHLSPNYADLDVYLNNGGSVTTGPHGYDGYLTIESDAVGHPHTYNVHLIIADSVQFPEKASIRTACTRLAINNAGNVGNGGSIPYGGYNLNLFGDCDTLENQSGSDDHSGVYLYDGSPFILRIKGTDTVLYYYMFDSDWLSKDGMRPMEGLVVDSATYPDYQYGYTGRFLTKDSAVALEVEYFAPTDEDTCKFIVMKQRITNNTAATISGMYVGDLFDWDIPSDSGVENGSDFDMTGGASSRDFFYCYGGEYGPDTTDEGDPSNNDCVMADQRYGGVAFYNGVKIPFKNTADSLENPAGPWYTHLNPDWVAPTGGFVPGQIYKKISDMGTAWSAWTSTNPSMEDSLYQDLHMVSVFGKFDLGVNDTLVFVKILATENTGGLVGILATVDKARAWIANRPDIWTWPEHELGCCDRAGDANNNNAVNILDATYLINYLYKSGPPPPCKDEGDANGNNAINILDATYLINYLYKSGPAPKCGTTGT